jgi:hypothetical protein
MTVKQTPRQFRLPVLRDKLVPYIQELSRALTELVNKLRNDLDNGVTTFPTIDIAGIASVDVTDFEKGQVRFYKDTADSDKVYLFTRYDDDLYYELLTKL